MSSYPPPPPIPPELQERERPEPPKPKHPGWAASGMEGYASAFGFIGTILVFTFAGWGIDALAGTSPWGVIVALLLGFMGATLKMVRENSRVS